MVKLIKRALLAGSVVLSLIIAFVVFSAFENPAFKAPVLACQNGWPEFIALMKKDPIVFVMIIAFPLYMLVQVAVRMRNEGTLLDALSLPTVTKYLFICFCGMFAIIFFFAICVPVT